MSCAEKATRFLSSLVAGERLSWCHLCETHNPVSQTKAVRLSEGLRRICLACAEEFGL